MLVLGHRGASISLPDNTLAAFAEAVRLSADGVELDVRRTSDAALAVRHDETLDDGRPVVALAASDLPQDVPLLGAALDACAPLSVVNIEIKNIPGEGDFDADESVAAAVVAVLGARGELSDGRIVVSSFHLPTVDRVRELAPGLATGWLVLDATDPVPLIERAARDGHRAIHPHHAFVNEALVEAAHAAGLKVNTWTCDDPERIVWLESIGVDALVTNDPATALRALRR